MRKRISQACLNTKRIPFIGAANQQRQVVGSRNSKVLCKTGAHHRDLKSLSKLSRIEQRNHYKSDPVRVQSIKKQRRLGDLILQSI